MVLVLVSLAHGARIRTAYWDHWMCRNVILCISVARAWIWQCQESEFDSWDHTYMKKNMTLWITVSAKCHIYYIIIYYKEDVKVGI